ncbi:O-methyltransferase [Rugosimonospora africana]|uniref:O-methyltransferase n=1 Tax=Rugosimonospora africana TaxID=556532 RepID=A0A8J3QKH5_9ACTN|nr:O-methyltransferase [Rugosimonospora africana]GIH12645.1 O-methyltransferase [Rugosimonospora africana]
MSTKTDALPTELHAYLVAHGSQPDPVVADLIAETRAALPGAAGMQISPEQASLFTLLAKLSGARYAVEVGTFTGLSSIAIARGLPDDGHLVCCDVSEEFTSIARRYWERAGLTGKVELRLGPAADTLRAMPTEPHIDLAFIDADKTGYPVYWAELVPRMRQGGILLVDNVLRHGRVLSPVNDDDRAIVAFNDEVLADERVEAVMLPIGDGITLARRK